MSRLDQALARVGRPRRHLPPAEPGDELRHRSVCLNITTAMLTRRPHPPGDAGDAMLLWFLLMEGAAFAAALPAILGGRRCGFIDGRTSGAAHWPGVLSFAAEVCQACHRAADPGQLRHDDACWLRFAGGVDPAMVGYCGCGAVLTAPRWTVMSSSGVGCPRCGSGVELAFAGDADRWAEVVRRAGPPAEDEAAALLDGLAGFAQLRPEAGVWCVATHCAALVRARLAQVQASSVGRP